MNFTPAMTFGNWFVLFNRRQVFDAASMSLNTISFAVCCDSDPLVRTVRWRTVAKTLSIGFELRRWIQCSAGKSKKASRAGPGCLDSAPLDLSGFLPGYAERGALRFCRCVGRA
ncbi:hypothetical protein ABIF91_006764 [Bradyrhizobium sp. USDA 241]